MQGLRTLTSQYDLFNYELGNLMWDKENRGQTRRENVHQICGVFDVKHHLDFSTDNITFQIAFSFAKPDPFSLEFV